MRKRLEDVANNATSWIGSIESLLIHTLVFAISFSLVLFGIAIDRVLLVLTTVLSLEAIYLAIFIQMSVNKNTLRLNQVEKEVVEIGDNVDEIAEDVQGIQDDVEHIEKDIDEMQEDVEGIEKEVMEIGDNVEEIAEDVEGIEKDIDELQEDVEEISESENKK